eukprot:COSAG01_NODE_75731_length_193_cov_44.723404_1_plen_31_part_10
MYVTVQCQLVRAYTGCAEGPSRMDEGAPHTN